MISPDLLSSLAGVRDFVDTVSHTAHKARRIIDSVDEFVHLFSPRQDGVRDAKKRQAKKSRVHTKAERKQDKEKEKTKQAPHEEQHSENVQQEVNEELKSACAVLGVMEDDPIQSVKERFRYLTKMYHPDRNKNEGAGGVFARIAEAYRTILKTRGGRS